MSRTPPPPPPEVRALLDRERDVPPLPAAVRARALARARAALLAGDAALPAASPGAAPRTRWAAAAVLACVLSAAVGAAAYEVRTHLLSPSLPGRRPALAPPAAMVATPRAPSAPIAPIADVRPAPAPALATPRPSPADAVRAELRLLRLARAAVARGDFAGAMRPIAEHARQFKDGRMAEEREALRVKALAGLGRSEEARRAAAAFETRFPHSVLLPAIREMPASQP